MNINLRRRNVCEIPNCHHVWDPSCCDTVVPQHPANADTQDNDDDAGEDDPSVTATAPAQGQGQGQGQAHQHRAVPLSRDPFATTSSSSTSVVSWDCCRCRRLNDRFVEVCSCGHQKNPVCCKEIWIGIRPSGQGFRRRV